LAPRRFSGFEPGTNDLFFAAVLLRQNQLMHAATDTTWIVAKAHELGFDLCEIAPTEGFVDSHLKEWLERGYAGRMGYLHDSRRADIQQVLPNAKSIIVCAVNYNTSDPPSTEIAARAAAELEPRGWISRYAWGDDYHAFVGEKLEAVVAATRAHFGDECQMRAYVDTGPISERLAAQHAGLGWQAKNTCLIHEELGSWLFLGVILCSLELAPSNAAYGTPPTDLCGNCTLCLDACPTGALVEPYVMDARRCISYLTIELRESIPTELRAPMGWQVFGCDICQDVCPWNRKAPLTLAPSFQAREKMLAPELVWLLSLDEKAFKRIFSGSAVRRTKWRGLIRNACIAAGNAAEKYSADRPNLRRLRECLRGLAASADPLLAEHAAWALARFKAAAE
jgi:epoxyqueuosine reductase